MMLSLLLLYWDTAVGLLLYSFAAQAPYPYPDGWLPFVPWLVISWLVYEILSRFLKKSRPLNALIILIIVLYIAEVASVVWLYFGTEMIDQILMAALFLMYPFGRACQYSIVKPEIGGLLSRFEGGALCLGFGIMVDYGWNLNHLWLVPMASALIMVLVAMILSRTVGSDVFTSHPAGAFLTILASFGLIGGAFAVTESLTDVHYESGVKAALLALWKAVTWLAGVINAIMEFLFSLFPDASAEIEIVLSNDDAMVPQQVEESAEGNPVLALIILIVLVVGLLGFILWKCRKLKLGRTTDTRTGSAMTRGKIRFGKYLRLFWKKVSRKIRMNIALYQKRNTCYGCYLWLIRRNRRTTCCMQQGETPHEYLERLAEVCNPLGDEIRQLQSDVDRELYWYGAGSCRSYEDLRKEWARFLRTEHKNLVLKKSKRRVK